MKNRHKNILKKAALITAVYFLLPESADALTGGAGAGGATAIAGIDNLWRAITPYLAGAFSVGGILYSAINIRKVVIGDYRAAAPAAISAISAIIGGIGINGVFGANALSVLLP